MTTLDHVGFVSRDLEGLRAAFASLGFSLTVPQPLMARGPDATSRTLDQSSCHAVLESGYIELSSVRNAAPDHHLARYARGGDALVILALGTDDVAAAGAACRRRGIAVTAPSQAARRINYGSLHGEARFCWCMVEPDDAPEGLTCFVHNETPELVYQTEVQQHPNTAVALCEMAIASHDPPATAARYGAILGLDAIHRGAEYSFVFDHTALRIMGFENLDHLAGSRSERTAGHFAMLTVAVRDLDITRRVLVGRGTPFIDRGTELFVPSASAGGALMRFVPATRPSASSSSIKG